MQKYVNLASELTSSLRAANHRARQEVTADLEHSISNSLWRVKHKLSRDRAKRLPMEMVETADRHAVRMLALCAGMHGPDALSTEGIGRSRLCLAAVGRRDDESSE